MTDATAHPFTELVRGIRAVAWRHLYKWIKMPANLIPTVAFPMVFFIAFAGGLSAVRHIPGFNYAAGYTTYQYGFSLCQASAFGGMATGFSIAADFSTGFSKRLLVTSTHRASIVLGYMCSSLIRAVIVCSVLTTTALLAGMNVRGGFTDLASIFGLCVLLNMTTTLWGAGVMMRTRNPQFAPAMQVPIFLSVFLAPVFVPLPLLHGWLHGAASHNPMSFVLISVRGFLNNTPDHVVAAWYAAFGLWIAALIWGFTGLRSATRAG